MGRGRKVGHALARILVALLSALLLLLACVALILAQPKSDEAGLRAPQPSLPSSPALTASEESGLRDLIASFPVPVMRFMGGSGMRFVSGTASDAPLEGGLGRVVTLYWQTEDGQPLILRSIYPANAFSLLETDFHFTPVAGPTLFGASSVRMESGDVVRIHRTTEEGLYAINLPQSLAPRLAALTRSLQLFTAESSSNP